MKLPRILSRLLRRREGDTEDQEVLDLRAAFASRYHNFKLLLTANNKALEIMSELEKALEGAQPFGMNFVRSRATAVTVTVFRIIKHLDELAPGKYTELYSRFRHIESSIEEALTTSLAPVEGPLVAPLKDVDVTMVDQVGGKMANIGELKNRAFIPTPDGFVITARAYHEFMAHNELQAEIDRRIQSVGLDRMEDLYKLSADVQQLIVNATLPRSLETAIWSAYTELEQSTHSGVRVSMRSSAVGEDASRTSFAGQFRSELNVSKEHLIQAYKTIVASKYSLPAITYRLNKGIPDETVPMCVGCMAMVDPVSAGVTYSRDPLNFTEQYVFIHAVWGLAKAVVDGTVEADLFVVSRNEHLKIVRQTIGEKALEFRCFPEEGVCRNAIPGPKSSQQCITDRQALELADIAIRLEDYYGAPQDIEWAIDHDGAIYVLQCRPLQQIDVPVTRFSPTDDLPDAPASILQGGVTASPGVGSGEVFIVRNDVDKLQFPRGAVLVALQSLPTWAPLLSSAAAVVTELGGVAGHLANVAREFGVPALFGVPGAFKTLENGELVTVDATGRRVYRGEVSSLLAESPRPKNLMAGTPIFMILQNAARHIIPLNLIDPDSPDFHPKKCRTLHDITRYCHEKSVHEMFNFGKEHQFSERASKQLVCHIPMQWWIINLDDGFKEDVKGKFVTLDNIVSIPMLAIWEGVTAVPWQGPPPVHAGGFMSVLMQATTNPALDPAMGSPYAARNYFMLSKNFCSLMSRFGFHFSTVEALVGERPSENYISFSFKGGAADFHRRVKRALFVAEILNEFDFRTDVREDNAFARIEGFDMEFMKMRLRIIGYLIIHTRQLDMVMSNDNSVWQYRMKMLDDIHTRVIHEHSS